ncbi:hypothetical protein ACFE04_004434 [Oxalis oulophora]
MASSQCYPNNVRETFESFFKEWLDRQQNLLDQLRSSVVVIDGNNALKNDTNNTMLSDHVLSHYLQYYSEKSKAANQDVLLFFSPPWFSSLEKTLFWIGGFKPSILFKVIDRSINDLTTYQKDMIEQIKAETTNEEKKLSGKMAGIQESLGDPPLFNMARKFRELVDGEVNEFNEGMEKLKEMMLDILNKADELRGKVATDVLRILNPIQSVRLLAETAQFQLNVRNLGWQRDSASGISQLKR